MEGRIRGTDMGMTGAPSSGATSSPDPGSDTPASMGHERLMVLPFAFYPLTSSFPPHGISPKIFPFVSISPPLSILPPSSLISQLQEEVMSSN